MDLSFPKKEHLCLKRRFDALIAQGKSFFIYPFRVIYLVQDAEPGTVPVQVAISVKKKQFKHAVTRNLIKRRFRECWRHNKSDLHECLGKEGKSVYILMIYGAGEVMAYSEMNIRLQQSMHKLVGILSTEKTP